MRKHLNGKMAVLVLGSNSPRRKELLAGLGVAFDVRIVPGIDESYPDGLTMEEIPVYISKKKASAYTLAQDEVLITSDTIVWVDGQVLGKPKDERDAFRMLRLLSGKTHQVVTGVFVGNAIRSYTFSCVSDVTFKELSDEEIKFYITNYKPFDKAGSYGIQEWIGYIGVTEIKGSYFNIMGLPVQRLYSYLKKFDIL